MPSNRERERGEGYPKLTAEQINLVIDSLVWSIRDHDLGQRIDLAEETASHLVGFYTRRWGLPPAITGRQQRIRELVADMPAPEPAAIVAKTTPPPWPSRG